MTGRGFGPCGYSMGRGFGFGKGLMRWFAPISKKDVKEDLESYKKSLEEELEEVKAEQKRLEEDA